MQKLRIISIFIIAVGIYILFRSYQVWSNMNIIENGIETTAIITDRDQNNITISYTYKINGAEYIRTETTDRETFINYVIGDKISVFVDQNNNLKSIIKDNQKPISLMNFSFNSDSNMIVISYWYGILLGVLLLAFGLYRLIKELKRTDKTFS